MAAFLRSFLAELLKSADSSAASSGWHSNIDELWTESLERRFGANPNKLCDKLVFHTRYSIGVKCHFREG